MEDKLQKYIKDMQKILVKIGGLLDKIETSKEPKKVLNALQDMIDVACKIIRKSTEMTKFYIFWLIS